ncbi:MULTISPECIES: TIGR00341 family protein [Halorussus]|uniref:TIGR00341 family protein n=1 Tax=Halorussus TaxID=1070314 RepID=UPI0020A15084|nr:TIGR00341 family protein [Halorussus vallis]USZ74637.1 TIGR00341 family protein [Halorussus vallis]
MRLIEVLVPDERRDGVLTVLDEENIDYVLTAEESGREAASVVRFPLPTQAVEGVLSNLREAGLEDDRYTVVASAESARTRNFSELEDRFVAGGEEDDRIAHEEIRAKAMDMTPDPLTYYAMTLLSALVATAGLLLDSPAIVVGSMVIAPQVGSALTASVGAVLGDRKMAFDGLASQAYGLALAIVGALVFGGVLQAAAFVPPALDVTTVSQIGKRASPGLLSLAVAIAAGSAGAFGLATALPVSLVGVMIAAAIVPAAAAVGIGLAAGRPVVALGALSLLVVNALAINLMGIVTLRLLGYQSRDVPDDGRDRMSLARKVVAAGLVLAVTAGAGVAMAQQMAFENAANRQVQDVLAQDQYAELELSSVETEYNDRGLFDPAQEVTVVVSRPSNVPYPRLAEEVADSLADRLGQRVRVEIQFVERQRATA